ncbi:DUF4159 domain-containing protein [Roseibacillus ishigakijimensis]|uniref:DUF4159 domain-containing protein n=1 Tax=Roseibacillus ishigakijimensis TaxID=454146 RepID=A0A934RKF7_9BACT|nr:DUF4159 domain-containing protein [Roseibacillus ishigakijimensis]MBK1833069.1 DUF4159 domain-containing protein [Roseibacillus ishigakijimensis]
MIRHTLLLASLALPLSANPTTITCGNLVYGKNQTSVCFANTFLSDAARETGLDIDPEFDRIKLASEEVFRTPLCIFTGEGTFQLNEAERANLKRYVMNGGFIIVSPGCSDQKWNAAFKRELAAIFPAHPLEPIEMDHELFSMVHTITHLDAGSRVGHIKLHGVHVNGRLAILYSPEGLNNAGNAKGCCCCGGNELRNSREINVNALVYALVY